MRRKLNTTERIAPKMVCTPAASPGNREEDEHQMAAVPECRAESDRRDDAGQAEGQGEAVLHDEDDPRDHQRQKMQIWATCWSWPLLYRVDM